MKLFGKEKKNKPEENPEAVQPKKSPMQIGFEKNLKFLNRDTYPLDFFQSLWNGKFGTENFTVGETDIPTGEIVLADPLAYLGSKYETVLENKIPTGSYPVEISVLRSPAAGIRVAAARLKIKEADAVEYKLAMPKGYTSEDYGKPGVFSFFGVDTGTGCFADKAVSEEFYKFTTDWHNANQDKNIYDDYFKELFEESYKKYPDIQTPYGDFLLWKIPESGNRLIMFSSGLGDGVYSGYWGIDKKGEAAELVVPFMNPEFFDLHGHSY